MDLAIVIPARMASTRFPGKPLCDLAGKPMVQWVYEAAVASGVSDRVIVATPDAEIAEACSKFGAECVMTRGDHPSGTDRLAEVAGKLRCDGYVNVQGDEPMVDPVDVRSCAATILDGHPMGSLFAECPQSELENPAVVKVVTALDGSALYFSRHCLPYRRNEVGLPTFKHIGMYAYDHKTVGSFALWEPSPLEQAEGLEQLRFLEHGVKIMMAPGRGQGFGVDTPEQAEQARAILQARA